MDTLTPAQPQPIAEPIPTVPVQPILPTQPEKKSKMPVIISITLSILIIAGVVGYIIFTGQTAKPQPTVSLPLPTELPMPTTNPIQPVVSTVSASPTTKVSPTGATGASPTAKPTMIPNPDGNTFTSNTLGIAFYYSKSMGSDKTTTIKTTESGTKMYIYESTMQPDTGQSIERFAKSATDTLSQAITKKFLTGIPITDCFVQLDPVKPKPTVTKATISYPIPANADLPNFTYGEKCPDGYSESNGIAYFYEDSNYPDRFYFIKIGQYSIPANNTNPESKWQDTIVIF